MQYYDVRTEVKVEF